MPAARTAFKAFLSHRYKSPQINLHFLEIFNRIADVQFEVDVASGPVNVTRLERRIRDCEAFVGIYPYPGAEADPTRPALEDASKYFRLELDMVLRARKPVILFKDQRYGDVIPSPAGCLRFTFNHREIGPGQASPNSARYETGFRNFVKTVLARRKAETTAQADEKARVAVILPQSGRYGAAEVELILSKLRGKAFDGVLVSPLLDGKNQSLLSEADWVVVDIGDPRCAALAAYLHGRFVPSLRLRPDDGPADVTGLEQALFGAIEVGYCKDVLSWSGFAELESKLDERLATLKGDLRRIDTLQEAVAYFPAAALRKENVFISYRGSNREKAVSLINAFKARFQTVFDYKDGESIRPGQPWLKEIFDRIADSAVGVPLLSPEYLESENCAHELREMVARRDGKKLVIFPVMLAEVESPSFLSDLQYMRPQKYPSSEALVDHAIRVLDELTGQRAK